MRELKIVTPRLELHGGTAEIARAAFENLHQFGQLLDGRASPEWPPPLTEDVQEVTALALEADPELPGWYSWYFVERASRLIVGQGGFKGKPVHGTVEIGYSLVPSSQGKGYATEAAGGLIQWVFDHPKVTRVVAETLPHLAQSIRVMVKNGMSFIAEDKKQGIVRYGVSRVSRSP